MSASLANVLTSAQGARVYEGARGRVWTTFSVTPLGGGIGLCTPPVRSANVTRPPEERVSTGGWSPHRRSSRLLIVRRQPSSGSLGCQDTVVVEPGRPPVGVVASPLERSARASFISKASSRLTLLGATGHAACSAKILSARWSRFADRTMGLCAW